MNDLVSVIVPIYNTKQYLSKCIDSILSQTYRNIEILLINDGSPDDSKLIMEKYKQKDNRIKCYYKKNGGLSDARNYGVKHSKGKYICFIDSDDWVSNLYIEKLVNEIRKNNYCLVACEFDRVYNNKITKNNISKEDIKGFKVPAAWNKIYLKETIQKYNLEFPKGKWYEDLTMTSMYAMTCSKIKIINESLYFYRQNNDSIMHTYDDRIFQIYDSLEKLTKFAKQNDLYEYNAQGLEFAYIYHVLIGTVFRASFMAKFSKQMIKEIVKHVEEKYPQWYNNKIVKEKLDVVYKTFLFLIKIRCYTLIYIILKMFNKYMYL